MSSKHHSKPCTVHKTNMIYKTKVYRFWPLCVFLQSNANVLQSGAQQWCLRPFLWTIRLVRAYRSQKERGHDPWGSSLLKQHSSRKEDTVATFWTHDRIKRNFLTVALLLCPVHFQWGGLECLDASMYVCESVCLWACVYKCVSESEGSSLGDTIG